MLFKTSTLVTLAVATLSSLVAAAPTDPFAPCRGFSLTTPGPSNGPEEQLSGQAPADAPTYPSGSSQTVTWALGDSKLTQFSAVELFNQHGIVDTIFVGPIDPLAQQVQVTLPQAANGVYFFRAWASTAGPDCLAYSSPFHVSA